MLFDLVCSGLFVHWSSQSKIHLTHFTCFSLLCSPNWEVAKEFTSPQKLLNVTFFPSSTPMSFRSLFSPPWSPSGFTMSGISWESMFWNSWAVRVSALLDDAEWKFVTRVLMASSRSVYLTESKCCQIQEQLNITLNQAGNNLTHIQKEIKHL